VVTSVVLCASTLCAPLIDGPRRRLYPLHRNFAAVQLADLDGRVRMCVTSSAAVRLPHAVVVASLPRASSPVAVGGGTVGWDGHEGHVSRWFEPAQPVLPSLCERLDPAAIATFPRTWSNDLGRGDGLTPYADDVVCGSLVLLRAVGHPAAHGIAAAVEQADLERRTTATSAALLRLAGRGYCIDPLADLLAALATGLDVAPDAAVTTRLLAVGHTSGAGLLEGVRALLRTHVGGAAA